MMHKCVSELRQCAYCQVEQAADSKIEDLIEKLKNKWKASLNVLDGEFWLVEDYQSKIICFNKETEIKFRNYLRSTAELAKDDIDIKVESLKSELDAFRDSMLNYIDETVGQLEEYVTRNYLFYF